MNRRSFLKTSAAVGFSALGVETHAASDSSRSRGDFIDGNVNLSHWPSRRVRDDDTAALVAMLRRQGVVQACALAASMDYCTRISPR